MATPKWDSRTTGLRYDQPAFWDVVSGQTIRVDLRPEIGRPVVGRVVMPDAAGHRLDLAGSSANLLVKLPEVPYPPGLALEDKQEWLSRWRITTAAREYRYRQVRRVAHSLTFQPDGSFRIDEVQPGAYELQIRLPWFDELIRDVTVPEPAAGQGGAPVDVGTFALKRSRPQSLVAELGDGNR